MKVERVTYDVMTPSAARGILEAVHWKPAIRWEVERIHVLRPIRFQSFRRNELSPKIPESLARSAMKSGNLGRLGLDASDQGNRAQRATTLLADVAYLIEARFHLTSRAEADDTPAKHISMFNRRAEQGQCFHRPCLGTREFAADFALAEADPVPFEALSADEQRRYVAEGPGTFPTRPVMALPAAARDRELGYMLHDIDFANDRTSRFFRARMDGGVVEVAKLVAEQGLAA